MNKIFLMKDGKPKYGKILVHIPIYNKLFDICITLLYNSENYKAIEMNEEALSGTFVS